MKNILTTLIIIFGLCTYSQAQELSRQVISNGGGYATGGNYKLSYTIGESLTGTVESGSFILSQGFQQGSQTTGVSIKELDTKVDYTLFPNPSTNFVNISLEYEENLEATIFIVNAIGETVSVEKNFNQSTHQIQFDVTNLANGIYYMNIRFENQALKQIAFVKK